jgi:hypothetical protein
MDRFEIYEYKGNKVRGIVDASKPTFRLLQRSFLQEKMLVPMSIKAYINVNSSWSSSIQTNEAII